MRPGNDSTSQSVYDSVVEKAIRQKLNQGEFVSFDFAVLGPQADLFRRIDFMLENFIYFRVYVKTVEKFAEWFYAEFNSRLGQITLETVRDRQSEVLHLLTYLEHFLHFRCDEKMKLMFTSLDRLVFILENSTSIPTVLKAIQILFDFFKLGTKTTELVLFNAGPLVESRLAAVLLGWKLGPRLCGTNSSIEFSTHNFDEFVTVKDSPLFEAGEAPLEEDRVRISFTKPASDSFLLSQTPSNPFNPSGCWYGLFWHLRKTMTCATNGPLFVQLNAVASAFEHQSQPKGS